MIMMLQWLEMLFGNKYTTTQQQSKHSFDFSPVLKKSKITQPTIAQVPYQIVTQFIQPVMTQVQVVKSKQSEFIKIGDIVCIEFIKQIFDELKEYDKIDEGKDNLILTKIIEKPDFEYTIIYFDGIVDKEFKDIPKDIKSSSNHFFTDQNKSIFRIEVPQEFKFTKQYNELKVEMASVEFT